MSTRKPVEISILFDDGSSIRKATTDGYYRTFNTHRVDPEIKGRIIEHWEQHIISWREGTHSRE